MLLPHVGISVVLVIRAFSIWGSRLRILLVVVYVVRTLLYNTFMRTMKKKRISATMKIMYVIMRSMEQNLGGNRVPNKRWSKVREPYTCIPTFHTHLWLNPSRRTRTSSRVILITSVVIQSSRLVLRVTSIWGRATCFETVPLA